MNTRSHLSTPGRSKDRLLEKCWESWGVPKKHEFFDIDQNPLQGRFRTGKSVSALRGDLILGTCGAPLGAILASPGTPLERFWPPPGHPRGDVPHFSNESRNNFTLDVNDFGTPFPYFVNTCHTQTLQRIKDIIQNNPLTIDPRKSFLLFY